MSEPKEEPASFSAESYFATQPAPTSLEHDIAGVREFVSRQAKEGRNVVLVTVSNVFSCSTSLTDRTISEWWDNRAPGAQRVSAQPCTRIK